MQTDMTGDGVVPDMGGYGEQVQMDPPLGRVALAVVLALGAGVWVLAGIGVIALAGGLR